MSSSWRRVTFIQCSVVCWQTFHTSGFGDEEFDVSSSISAERQTHGLSSEVIDVDDDVQFVDSPVEEEQVENYATLFMSCSPGRDTEEDEDEDEDDSVPLSKVYGVSDIWDVLYFY